MFRKEQDTLRQIAKASEAIRRKHRLLKMGKEAAETALKETFQPIVAPLQKLVDVKDVPIKNIKIEKVKKDHDFSFSTAHGDDSQFDTTLLDQTVIDKHDLSSLDMAEFDGSNNFEKDETHEELTNKYLLLLNKNRKLFIDMVYGVRKLPDGSLIIGDTPIAFEGSQIKLKGKKNYLKTVGLLELIFKQKPNQTIVTSNDLTNYKEILQSTNAHRKKYSSSEPIHTEKSSKYTDVIAKLFKSTPKKGGGSTKRKKHNKLPQFMIAKKQYNSDYVYWDDPNELVDRLRLLIASQQAGNPSHNNEIMSIVEELREARIIY